MALNIENIVAELEQATILELNDLVKAIEDKFGVTAAAPVAVAAAGGAAGAGEEKSEFDVILKDAGAGKINVIKVVREVTGLGLKEAKADAEALKAKLEEAGATVELK